LVRADPARSLHLLGGDADAALTALLAATRKAAAAAKGSSPLMRILRRAKAEAALLVALADIGGAWPVVRVTAALTDVAETALRAAVRYLLREAVKAKKLIAPDPKNPEAGSGYIVLAMGKMGGRELNYSSDIDLMVFLDAQAVKFKRGIEPAPGDFPYLVFLLGAGHFSVGVGGVVPTRIYACHRRSARLVIIGRRRRRLRHRRRIGSGEGSPQALLELALERRNHRVAEGLLRLGRRRVVDRNALALLRGDPPRALQRLLLRLAPHFHQRID